MTTRGFIEEDFIKVAEIIVKALKNIDNDKVMEELKLEVLQLTTKLDN
jgi:glycine hydroxymethyltransferase